MLDGASYNAKAPRYALVRLSIEISVHYVLINKDSLRLHAKIAVNYPFMDWYQIVFVLQVENITFKYTERQFRLSVTTWLSDHCWVIKR